MDFDAIKKSLHIWYFVVIMIAYKQRVMDMDKLTMAHEYMVSWLKSGNAELDSAEELALFFFDMAEIMQAEADKRKVSGIPDVLRGANGEIVAVKVCEEEWQPDWSQAPDGFNRFVIGSVGGHGFFTNIEPELMGDYYYIGSDGVVFHNHGYQGNWQDSLRKRPQGI